MTTHNLKGVEIFSTGKWNSDNFTVDDLQGMVNTFNATKSGVKPYIKLGHNKEQKLAQEKIAKDGLPSLGWIDNMYLKGDKLVADIVGIPKKVYDLIKVGAYKKVSCEMFFNVKIKEKKFSHLITAVSLLGADTPAVMNLEDIHAMYFESEDKPKLYFEQALDFTFNDESQTKETPMPKTEAEIKLEIDLETKEKEFAAEKERADKLAADKAALDSELAELKKFKAAQDQKDIEAAIALKAEQMKSFTATLVTEKLASPAMQPLITELLSDKKEFSVKSGDKELKTKEEVLKEMLRLFKAAADVNFEVETTGDNQKEFSADKEKAVEAKIAKLQKDNPKMSYKKAYTQAMKEC